MYINKLIKYVVSILFTEINLISNKLSKYPTNYNDQKLFFTNLPVLREYIFQ